MRATIKSFVLGVGLTLLYGQAQAEARFADEAEKIFIAAQNAYKPGTTNFAAALNYAIAAFDWAEFPKNEDYREAIAEGGIQASREAIALKPAAAAGHYYLALNLGQLARTKMLGALKLIGEMEREFLKSIELDRKFDYGGASRALGVLYMETPSWSIGSKTKARENMEKALELAPNYPDNYLTFMEALLNWKERETLATKMTAYAELLPKAKKEFGGKEWEWEWTDWDKRWVALEGKAKKK